MMQYDALLRPFLGAFITSKSSVY